MEPIEWGLAALFVSVLGAAGIEDAYVQTHPAEDPNSATNPGPMQTVANSAGNAITLLALAGAATLLYFGYKKSQ